jgi:formate-dependent nitrite reductase membrane component NrfD
MLCVLWGMTILSQAQLWETVKQTTLKMTTAYGKRYTLKDSLQVTLETLHRYTLVQVRLYASILLKVLCKYPSDDCAQVPFLRLYAGVLFTHLSCS